MNFLQPMILIAMPLIGVPVLIHLINQYRHRTINWGAMLFLKKARRMTTGTAKLRFWLILLMRTLAVAGLLFALSRPLASGWLGLTVGGAADTAIIVLDRSASMEQTDQLSSRSKREAGLEKIDGLLRKVGRNTKVVLIENTQASARELDSPDQLLKLPETAPTATSADIAGMLESALDYVTTNQSGRTDIWVCSDLRQTDWDIESGRWDAIREELAAREAVRLFVLAYPESRADNLAIRLSNLRRRQLGTKAELLMDLEISRIGEDERPVEVPLEFVINGARSTINVTVASSEFIRRGFSIPIDPQLSSGEGRVELPVDSNPQDNVFHFAFAEPPVRRTIVISDDDAASEFLRLAAATPADNAFSSAAETLPPSRLAEVDWEQTALVLWQAPLPSGRDAQQLERFVKEGRTVIFFPPVAPTNVSCLGGKWTAWQDLEQEASHAVKSWRDDLDLLRNTDNGSPLPVGQLKTYRCCPPVVEQDVVLAQLANGQPLLTRTITDQGSVYFVSTLPSAGYSNFANEGVVVYVAIQRAINQSLARLGIARSADAGEDLPDLDKWTSNASDAGEVLISERRFQAGSYRQGERWLAINRPALEDRSATVDETALKETFADTEFTLIRDDAGSEKQLANEIWRVFLLGMILALFAEAVLCMPDQK